MATDNPQTTNRNPHSGIPTAYDNSALLDLVGREEGKVALLIGGGPSGANWEGILDYVVEFKGKGREVVVVTVNGCCQDRSLRGIIDYSVMLECDPPLPDWQWTPLPGAVVVMNELLVQPDWWGYCAPDLAVYQQHSCRELVLARRNNGAYGPKPAAGEDWPPHETDPRCIRHGLHIGPDLGVAGVPPLGTSLAPALHLCFALGCREVHSVGFDLCRREGDVQHWYEEPRYGEDPRKPKWQWREKLGLQTSEWWYQSALYIEAYRVYVLAHFGLTWQDHSDGMLQAIRANWPRAEKEGMGWLCSPASVRHEASCIDWGMEPKPEVRQ